MNPTIVHICIYFISRNLFKQSSPRTIGIKRRATKHVHSLGPHCIHAIMENTVCRHYIFVIYQKHYTIYNSRLLLRVVSGAPDNSQGLEQNRLLNYFNYVDMLSQTSRYLRLFRCYIGLQQYNYLPLTFLYSTACLSTNITWLNKQKEVAEKIY